MKVIRSTDELDQGKVHPTKRKPSGKMDISPSVTPRGAGSRPHEFFHFNPYFAGSDTATGARFPSISSRGTPSAADQTMHPPMGQNGNAGFDHPSQQLNGVVPSGENEGLLNGTYEPRNASDMVNGGSQTTDNASRDLDEDTSNDTPNDSMTSISMMSSCGRRKSTTPPPAPPSPLPTTARIIADGSVNLARCRPKSSIPARLSAAVYGQQCITAAVASRLNPYALHRKEQEALQDHLCHLHVTVYLNIRNGILRLWTRNSMVSVTKEEALGCAKDYRWMNLASFAFEWLVRNGYINFGCVEIPLALAPPKRGRRKEGPVIVVIGAGMSGLGCARHLEGLFRHYNDASTTPRVVVLEGRRRVGGRIYSHPLRSLQSTKLAPGLVPKAEMGAQIIVGFEQGNPLDQIIRGQLALPHHMLRDVSTIYDVDGNPVDERRDAMDEKLYNDALDRSGLYRHKAVITPTAEGDRDLIDSGRDSSSDDGLTVRQYEEARAAGTIGLLRPSKRVRRGVAHKTTDIKTTENIAASLDPTQERPTALKYQSMGWQLNEGVSVSETVDLDPVGKVEHQDLGTVLDEGIRQYQRMLPMTPKDMRLINWHMANLEYANAARARELSLSSWDQDMGNEFDGEHAQVMGGYQQVPYGLFSLPTRLNLRTNKIVSKIAYDQSGSGKHKAMVHCEDGDSIAADKVVFTGSLGVLKHESIEFEPPLPDWKTGAVQRLGFGVLNKVILVFEKPFWDTERDMFGLLREPTKQGSMAQEDYAANRGRFYLFWNCMKTTGLPVLIGLMAGDAAHQAHNTPDEQIIAEVTNQLRNVFKNEAVPDPLETIVTRWGTDKFTRGSYSFVAAEALPGDYDLMAQSVGNLHFAGEATCGTHPATVHGAYLSGLRAASEVIESIVGPIQVPSPLVPDKGRAPEMETTPVVAGKKRKEPPTSIAPAVPAPPDPTDLVGQARSNNSFPVETPIRQAYDQAVMLAVHAELGAQAPKPAKIAGLNPFLLYQKDYWAKARTKAEEDRQAANKTPVRAPRDEIRAALGLMWRQADDEERRPYNDQAMANRQTNADIWNQWKADTAEWERRAKDVKERWCQEHPYESWQPGQEANDSLPNGTEAAANGVSAD